ncbi:MAG: hypothetical protein JJT90_07990 [Ectothiorhodospiraceae bacterium]|nr:hypothetical protein [Ectothiorhodospiraceae bacterium]
MDSTEEATVYRRAGSVRAGRAGRQAGHRLVALVAALAMALMLAALPPPSAYGEPSGEASPAVALNVLTPGTNLFLFEHLPVNVVFIGYEPGDGPLQIDVSRFVAAQSDRAVGVTMIPLFAGRIYPSYTVADIDLRIRFADQGFEDAFFETLLEIGQPRPTTLYQELYNEDPGSTQTIDGTLNIDARAVEAWLGEHASELGIHPSEPMVFFINWFGRDDFVFHNYRITGEPPADSETDFGEADARALIAWGGTPSNPARRVWFHDLSAGPDGVTNNWNLTDADVVGDGRTDYRLPPVWEYAEPGEDTYRPFDDLTGDLAKVLRYVAIDMLFASSPLYPPALTQTVLPEKVSVDVTRVAYPGRSIPPLDVNVVLQRLNQVRPWHEYIVNITEREFSHRLVNIQECWLTGRADPTGMGSSCFGGRGGGFAWYDLWFHLQDQRLQYVSRDSDYAIPAFLFSVFDEDLPVPFIAIADGDPRDGTQSHVVSYWTSSLEAFDYGHTDTVVHELGHHLGLSHPHDGIDTEFDPATGFTTVTIIRPVGDFYFTWVGGMSSTVMSYLRLTGGFSQFDLDRTGRWLTISYLNQSNHILAELLTSPRLNTVVDDILVADQWGLVALHYFGLRDYQSAAWAAKLASDQLLAAADQLGIPIQPQARPAEMKAEPPQAFFVSPIGPLDAGYHVPPGPDAYLTDLMLPDFRRGGDTVSLVPEVAFEQAVELRPAPSP